MHQLGWITLISQLLALILGHASRRLKMLDQLLLLQLRGAVVQVSTKQRRSRWLQYLLLLLDNISIGSVPLLIMQVILTLAIRSIQESISRHELITKEHWPMTLIIGLLKLVVLILSRN